MSPSSSLRVSDVRFSKRRPLRVLTLNVLNRDGPYADRRRMLREGLRRLAPDVIAFQEAWRDDHYDQASDLLDGWGYHIIHQSEFRTAARANMGNAIASRWPLQRLPLLSLQVNRRSRHPLYAALPARVLAPEPAGPFLFVNCKPSWELHCERERELQAARIAGLVERHADYSAFPTILAGDFDATPDSAGIRFLSGLQSLNGKSAHYRDAWLCGGDGTAGHTWTYRNGLAREIIRRVIHQPRHARRIDYIFLGSPHEYRRSASVRACRVVLTRPRNGVWASDHYGVYAEIEALP